jgi:hypothetical protein
MNERQQKDNDNKLVLKNSIKFKNIKIWDGHYKFIIVPVTINICVNTLKYKIDFIKYCKYMIDILNDGFSGNIESPYKNSKNETNFKYGKTFIKEILENNNISNIDTNADIIYNYVNTKNDTGIRFYLNSIVYHDIYIEEKFEGETTENFIEKVSKKGFKIMDKHYKHLNINIIRFNCSTLGISTFPWITHVSKKISSCMQVFIDFCTLHPNIANNNYNRCRTLIHEVGHIFGLRHSFSHNTETLKVYEILLGTILNDANLLGNINSTNKENFSKSSGSNIIIKPINNADILHVKKKLNHKHINVQLYPDIPIQKKPTNYDPFYEKKFPFFDNIPNNFACFMDFGPDVILTHFTKSQIKIMHYMIRMFKPYLIKKSNNELKNYNNTKIKFYYNKKNTKNTSLNIILDDNSHHKQYIVFDKKNHFKYSMINIEENLKNLIYID